MRSIFYLAISRRPRPRLYTGNCRPPRDVNIQGGGRTSAGPKAVRYAELIFSDMGIEKISLTQKLVSLPLRFVLPCLAAATTPSIVRQLFVSGE